MDLDAQRLGLSPGTFLEIQQAHDLGLLGLGFRRELRQALVEC
jgi:hypothetical protein